jgi:hypothetical protein
MCFVAALEHRAWGMRCRNTSSGIRGTQCTISYALPATTARVVRRRPFSIGALFWAPSCNHSASNCVTMGWDRGGLSTIAVASVPLVPRVTGCHWLSPCRAQLPELLISICFSMQNEYSARVQTGMLGIEVRAVCTSEVAYDFVWYRYSQLIPQRRQPSIGIFALSLHTQSIHVRLLYV